jgi:DNA invertase Pin-like site-specific DNA recombinase
MSTEHQQYYPENQLDVVRQYAASHNMEIVQVYSDHGMSGDLKSLQEVIRLIEKLQEQEPYLNAPEFVVNFIDPVTKKPVTAEDLEKW